jgi:hypothetical protein
MIFEVVFFLECATAPSPAPAPASDSACDCDSVSGSDSGCFCLTEFTCAVELVLTNSKVEHPNVATLVGVRAYPPDYFFFYHLYENGNLGDALHEADWRPTLQQILTIAIQLGCRTTNPKIPFLSQITTEGILIKLLCVQHVCKKTTIF